MFDLDPKLQLVLSALALAAILAGMAMTPSAAPAIDSPTATASGTP